MTLEVYYPTDIRNALLAAEQSVNAAVNASGYSDDPNCPQSAYTAGFLVGYRAALTTLALAFGLARAASQPAHSELWQPSFLAKQTNGRSS